MSVRRNFDVIICVVRLARVVFDHSFQGWNVVLVGDIQDESGAWV